MFYKIFLLDKTDYLIYNVNMDVNILFIGDVVGECGCDFLMKRLPRYKKEQNIDFCIINGENSAKGNGITPFSAEQLFTAGADIITTGNHIYRRQEIYDLLDSSDYILRPENYYPDNPGSGIAVIDKPGYSICVINLAGNAFCDVPADNAFTVADLCLEEIDTKVIIVDFHAEATSEKRSMGFYLDGRVSAVIGTHTHVQTADEEILPDGTAYMTDAGMTGPVNSVLGVKPELTIKKFKTGMPVRFENPDEKAKLEGCIIKVDTASGKAKSIERIRLT